MKWARSLLEERIFPLGGYVVDRRGMSAAEVLCIIIRSADEVLLPIVHNCCARGDSNTVCNYHVEKLFFFSAAGDRHDY